MPTFSIIIPFYNHWDLTHKRMMEIFTHVKGDFEVVLVNDASPDLDCHTGVGWWQKQTDRFPIKYVRNKENLGFGGSHNQGAKVASGEILIFLSNDVVISGNFLQRIEEIMYEYKKEVIIGGRVLYFDTGWNTIMLHGKQSIIVYPEGWLIAVSKEMWERYGGWDVASYGKFDAEDLDLGAWAIYNNVTVVDLNLPDMLFHMFGQTISKVVPNREEYTVKNIEIFRNKWTKLLESKFP